MDLFAVIPHVFFLLKMCISLVGAEVRFLISTSLFSSPSPPRHLCWYHVFVGYIISNSKLSWNLSPLLVNSTSPVTLVNEHVENPWKTPWFPFGTWSQWAYFHHLQGRLQVVPAQTGAMVGRVLPVDGAPNGQLCVLGNVRKPRFLMLNLGGSWENTGLVGGFNPSEKYWSMGRIILYIMENKHVPNHQPEVAWQLDQFRVPVTQDVRGH